MRWPLTRRRNSVDRARYEQVIDQRDDARSEAARHVRTIVGLCREIDALREQLAATRKRQTSHKRMSDAASLTYRLDVARKAASRLLAAYHAEKRRADHLQAQLDNASALDPPEIAAGVHWQSRRHDRLETSKGAAS